MSSPRGLPIADAPLLWPAARRAQILRAAITLALAALVGAAVVLAPRGGGSPTLPSPGGSTTEIVLDVSGSVGQSSFAVAGKALQRLSRTTGRVGLVLFSDSALEALPPGSPPAELQPFARVFTPHPRPRTGQVGLPRTRYEPNPWYPSFSGGTRMSVGLAAAARALRRDRVSGHILLLSDLGDAPDDRGGLRRRLISLAKAGIDLRVLMLPNAVESDRHWFEKLEGPHTVLKGLPEPPPARESQAGGRFDFPTWLAAIVVLLAIALAVNELIARSLRWRETV